MTTLERRARAVAAARSSPARHATAAAARRTSRTAAELVCTGRTCGLAYPVRDDIPVLLDRRGPPARRLSPVNSRIDAGCSTTRASLAGWTRRHAARASPRPARRSARRWSGGRETLASRGRPTARPRAVVVAGHGRLGHRRRRRSRAAGRPACPVPVVVHRGLPLPGWVGPLDLVVAVSLLGRHRGDAGGRRRGASAAAPGCVTVGAAGFAAGRTQRTAAGRCTCRSTPHGRSPRANLWALAVPVLMVADALGLADVPTRLLGRRRRPARRPRPSAAAGGEAS